MILYLDQLVRAGEETLIDARVVLIVEIFQNFKSRR